MLETVNNQAYIFLYTVFGGMLVGLVYDLFRVSRKVIKTKNIIVHLEDIIFWLVVSVLIFGILFVCNGGQIRGYAIIAIILGVILYAFVFSQHVTNTLLKVINIIKNILQTIYKILKRPVKVIFKILYIPISYIINILKKIYKYIKKVKKYIIYRIKLNIKNILASIKKF